MATVSRLQDAGIHNLRLAFTCTHTNVSHMQEVYEMARDIGVEFTCAVEHNSEHYFHAGAPPTELPPEELERQFLQIMKSELATLSPKRWARAYFMHGLHAFATGRGRLLPCVAGRDHFFMDPAGDIFTCNGAPFSMGNLANDDFENLWNSPLAVDARVKAAACKPGCWMICTPRTAIKAAWPRVLAWTIKQKLFGLRLGGGE